MEPREEITVQPVSNEVKQAIAKYREDFKEKSFSGRNPELGKMIKCQICNRRHRTAEICLQRFAKNKEDVELVARGHGHDRGRLRHHWSKKRLQVVDLTRRLIPFYPNAEEDFLKAKSRALNLLRKKWHEVSAVIQHKQKLSRAINRH
jgi:hypothetical protein